MAVENPRHISTVNYQAQKERGRCIPRMSSSKQSKWWKVGPKGPRYALSAMPFAPSLCVQPLTGWWNAPPEKP